MHSKIHIAHIVPTFDIGGLENGIINLINTLNQPTFSHSLHVLSGDAAAINRFKHPVSVHTLNKKKGNDPRVIQQLLSNFLKDKPQLIRTYGWGTWLEGLISSKLYKNTPLIHSEHGYISEQLSGMPARRRIAQKLAASYTKQIISVSDAISQTLIRDVGIPSKKIHTIINGVDTNRFMPDNSSHNLRHTLNINDNRLILGTVARLDPIKDISSVINALPNLPEVEYIIVGDGPERTHLEQLTQQCNVHDRVHFLGMRSDIPELMNLFDTFILPSIKEGTSNTLLEAMSAACPVIATHTGGTPDIITQGETGTLIPPQSHKSIISAVKQIENNRDHYHKQGLQAREQILKKWSLDHMVQQYESLYRQNIKQS